MKAAVLGSPVAHSLSPAMHRAAYRRWASRLDLRRNRVRRGGSARAARPAAARTGPGLSLTMPLKRAVLPLLDWTEPLATDVGGANTVIFAAGPSTATTPTCPAWSPPWPRPGCPSAGPVLILGAGATACSALAAVRGLGAARRQ